MESGKIHSLKYISLYIKGERMNNKERDEKFLKSWLKKKISITTSTVVSFLITGAIGGGAAYGAGNKAPAYYEFLWKGFNKGDVFYATFINS